MESKGLHIVFLAGRIGKRNAQRPGRLGAELQEVRVARLFLLHPANGPVIPRPGQLSLAQLPVGHRQEQSVVTEVSLRSQLLRLFQRRDRIL